MDVDKSMYFINPYNFARYPLTKKRNRSDMGSEKNTGVISCELKVATPLAIPDTAEKITDYSGAAGHNAYPFFSVGGKPVIPGSELRGLIRNVYETITDSCYAVINNDILTARTSKTNNPGLLYYKNNKWLLKDAQKKSAYTKTTQEALDKEAAAHPEYVVRDWDLSVQLTTNMQKLKDGIDYRLEKAKSYDNFQSMLGEELYDAVNGKKLEKISIIYLTESNGKNSAAYIFNSKIKREMLKNKMNSVKIEKKWGAQYSEENIKKYFAMEQTDRVGYHKKYYSEKIINHSVFIPANEVEIDGKALENAVDELNFILDLYYEYSNRNEKKKNTVFDKVRPSTSGKGVPVFYRMHNNKILLAPAQISREVYDKKVGELLDTYSKCKTAEGICPACSLFGIVSGNSLAVSSRVRFSDAKAKEGYKLSDGYVPLKILSSPKTTAHEFYATEKYSEEGALLRGRKFYLHNPKAQTSDEPYRKEAVQNPKDKSQKERSDLNASMRLLTEGTFGFNIYFDRISDNELKNLILALNLGENSKDGNLMHKLGHGKPLGLGSVKIKVNEVKLRTVGENLYKFEPSEDFNAFLDMLNSVNPLALKAENAEDAPDYILANSGTLDDLLNICNFKLCEGYDVSYPVITGGRNANDSASHRFFTWIRDASTMGNSVNRSEKGLKYKALPFVSSSADSMKLPKLKVVGKNVAAMDNSLNAAEEEAPRYGDRQSSNRGQNADYQGEKKKCFGCGKLFVTNYKGSRPLCPECLKKNKR